MAKQFRARLERMAADLKAATQATAADRAPVELDQQSVGRLSRMDALQVQAMALETERRRARALLRVEAALKRCDEGEFGYCIECGEEIPVRRLKIDPAAPLCVDCAS